MKRWLHHAEQPAGSVQHGRTEQDGAEAEAARLVDLELRGILDHVDEKRHAVVHRSARKNDPAQKANTGENQKNDIHIEKSFKERGETRNEDILM